jgi:hypothetical protein
MHFWEYNSPIPSLTRSWLVETGVAQVSSIFQLYTRAIYATPSASHQDLVKEGILTFDHLNFICQN